MLEVERLWGREPGWFRTLPKSEQTRLFAWFRVHQDPAGRAKSPGRTQRRSKAVKVRNQAASDFWGV